MTTTQNTPASIDGQIIPLGEATISVADQGLIRGDGVFEVMRLYDGVPFALDRHLQRLERSAQNLRLEIDLELIQREVSLLLKAGRERGCDEELVRIMLTRGGRRIVLLEPMPWEPEQAKLKTITYQPTLILDGVKSLSYGANMLASRLAQEQGFDEALLVTPSGRVLEAPTSSLFWVKDGQLRTPPLADHILASITRGVVLEATDAIEYETELSDLLEADEVFLASTVREVHPVSAIDEHQFAVGGPVSAATDKAAKARVAELLAAR